MKCNRSKSLTNGTATVSPANRAKRISCRKALVQIAETRETILTESARARRADERLLRLAVNEAESLAWQTSYPHLVFPVLAAEKVEALAAWNRRQEAMRERSSVRAMAA